MTYDATAAEFRSRRIRHTCIHAGKRLVLLPIDAIAAHWRPTNLAWNCGSRTRSDRDVWRHWGRISFPTNSAYLHPCRQTLSALTIDAIASHWRPTNLAWNCGSRTRSDRDIWRYWGRISFPTNSAYLHPCRQTLSALTNWRHCFALTSHKFSMELWVSNAKRSWQLTPLLRIDVPQYQYSCRQIRIDRNSKKELSCWGCR